MKASGGFTLIELVMTITIVGILASLSADMLTLPVKSYMDLGRRTTLIDNAEMALRRMQRDVRRALPNSVRLSADGKSLELLHILDGGRYRTEKDGSLGPTAGLCNGNPNDDVLTFAAADDCFEILGSLRNFTPSATVGEALIVYNLGIASGVADAYAGDNRSAVVNAGNNRTLAFVAKKFPLSSPQQRFFIVDTPVSYHCDTASGQLLRFSGYPIAATQATPPAGIGGQLLADKLADCRFSYAAGTASRAGLVTMRLTLTDDAGESVQLLHQVHVDNTP